MMRRLVAAFVMLVMCGAVAAQEHVAEPVSVIEGPQKAGAAAPGKGAGMSNDSVLRMHAAGLGDELVVQTIATQPGHYELDAESMIALKTAGLGDAVIAAMVNKGRRQITGSGAGAAGAGAAAGLPAPIDLSPVNEIGVYYKDRNGRWVLMESEPIHTKSSGWIKNTLSQGIVKQDMNGLVYGAESKLLLWKGSEFLIYTADGVDAGEYDLLQFRLNGKDREFRTLTGGVFHSSGGAKRDEVPFKATRVAARTWTFRLDEKIPGAEYGILPPGTGNITNGGKIYTFAITE
jgi:hypothetical protein